MALFGIRFDFRNPAFAGTTPHERYRAALDMVEWADGHGFVVAVLSEHHGSADDYLPSPLVMAAAFAARTRQIRLQIAAIVAPLHDPVRLAEDIAVVDQISGGRVDVVVTNGYVVDEFTMFGRTLGERATRTTETVETLRAAWNGTIERGGRHFSVTPRPYQPGGPKLAMGGSSEPAARRAARIGDGFLPSTPDVWEFYRDEMRQLGKPDPGPYFGGDTSFFHLSRDPDRTWAEIAPHALHEVNAYGRWMVDAGIGAAGGYQPTDDADALRASGQYRVITPEQHVDELRAGGPLAFAMFHPLMGGIRPELAWEGLHLFESDVLPHLTEGN